MDVHQCDKVDFPYLLFFFLSAFFTIFFHSFSIVAFASGINIAWGERSFIHTFRFPEASVSERQVSRIVWTIRNSRFHNIHVLFVCTLPHWCVHPRFAEQNNIWSLYFFLPKFSLEISRTPQVWGLLEEFCPTDTPCPQTRQHALNFHLRNKKIKWRAFFQTFLLERIRVPSCNTTQNSACLLQYQYKWILLQKLRLLFFFLGTTVSRMHVREYDLLHGTAVSRFTYSCFFLLLGIAFTLWSSFVQQRKSCEVQSMTLTDFCSYRHPNNHKCAVLVQPSNLHKLTWWHQYNWVE